MPSTPSPVGILLRALGLPPILSPALAGQRAYPFPSLFCPFPLNAAAPSHFKLKYCVYLPCLGLNTFTA